ncbi:unnamed protein product [Ceutorhynchus assimilis]|uniref:Transposase n=1 Tax=Ceutorhynchus assimilis TaxID=467358 RepID=A0A9N9MAL8_9CUCU|nr:unnamed protein product [Ceutorhynchus assimilis]
MTPLKDVSNAKPVDLLNEPMDTDKFVCQVITEEIGIQCELGEEVYHKYSMLFENDSDSTSIHSSELTFPSSDTEKQSISETSEKNDDCINDCRSDEEIMENSDIKSFSTKFEYVLVQTKALMTLFTFCAICKSPITDIKRFTKGAVLHIKYKCHSGHCQKLSSFENPEKCPVYLSGAILLNGLNFLPVFNFAKTLKLLFISSKTYYKTVRTKVSPVINKFWLGYKNSLYQEANTEKELWISGDGQYDSPGFSAKYVTYSLMNVKTEKILNFEILQRGMIEGDLEKAACEKALAEITDKLKVKLFLSDRHRGVGVLLRNKYPYIQHEYVWHLSKSLQKKLGKAEKKSKLLSEWNRAITNHLWCSSETCKGNSEVVVEKFTSLLKHICNIHEWTDENGKKKGCEHRQILDKEAQEIKWIRFGSTDYQILQTEIMNKMFLNDLKHRKNYCHTSSLESYHNIRLKYVPKRVHFSYNGMYIRSILAILDHNFNVGREVVGGDVQFPKSSKRWHFKNKYQKKTYFWKADLLQKILNYDSKTGKLPEVIFKVPKNSYKVEKPSFSAAKDKHVSRFTTKGK